MARLAGVRGTMTRADVMGMTTNNTTIKQGKGRREAAEQGEDDGLDDGREEGRNDGAVGRGKGGDDAQGPTTSGRRWGRWGRRRGRRWGWGGSVGGGDVLQWRR